MEKIPDYLYGVAELAPIIRKIDEMDDAIGQGGDGSQGPPGPQGPAGPQGPKGDKGDRGDTGAAGAQGAKGDTGAQGAPGTAGAQGPKGDTGTQGSAGATGAQGPPGAQGAKGDPGAQGPKGDTGAQGPAGPSTVPNVQNPISGDGQSGTPLGLKVSGVWNSDAPEGTDHPGLSKWGSDDLYGQPVYVDTQGKTRTAPLVIPAAAAKLQADGAGLYPIGTSVMTLNTTQATAGGWPESASATVVTFRRAGEIDANAIAQQWWYRTGGSTNRVLYRRYNGGWVSWIEVVGPAVPDVAGTYQSADISVSTTARHVEGSPACRVTIANPHTTRSLLVRTTLSCWMTVGSATGGPSFYVDIDNISGATPAATAIAGTSTVAEVRWQCPDGNVTVSANFDLDWIIAAGGTAIWTPAAAVLGGSTTSRSMRSTRLVATPIRYI